MVRRFVEEEINLAGVGISPDKLASARKKAGFEPADAAAALGCTTAHLSAVEKGIKNFSADKVAKACVLYKVDIWSIVDGVSLDDLQATAS
jgi:transcriptional regulator with XRE-family HTH domain